MTWREITAHNLNNLKNACVIDVRSPYEHAVERIPDSINVPLLDDRQRVEVGTIYKERGEIAARRHALTIISPKIPLLIDEIVALRSHGQTIVVYCWRGGLRSESVSSVLSIAGIDCYRLTGGFKAWRRLVIDEFETDAYLFKTVVLTGLTGTGKTEILHKISELGCSTLDLESLANHRGSVFGAIGLQQQPSQKNFEAALWQAMRQFGDQMVFIEGESRRIGKLSLPDGIFKRMERAPKILVTGSLEMRAVRIVQEYFDKTASAATTSNKQQVISESLSLLARLKGRLSNKALTDIQNHVANNEIESAVQLLLSDYYDPLYSQLIQKQQPFVLEVDSDDANKAADTIVAWSKSTPEPETSAPYV